MKRILNIILSFLIFSICNTVIAQELKIVESSAKSQPSWITDIEREYITASASGSTIEQAQQDALLSVKQQIAQSIVTNISTEVLSSYSSTQSGSTSLDTNSTGFQGEASYTSNTQNIIRSITDKIPFLQSISLNKASDFYWEKHYNKKSGKTRYDYYIKYYFSDRELSSLVAEFNAKQAEINATLNQMRQELDTFTQIESIDANMRTLRALRPEFADNDPRITQVDELVNTYRNQYKYISMEQVSHEDKRVVLQPMLNGRAVATSQIPTHKSICADRITKSAVDGRIVVTYDDFACRSGDDNYIDLTFKFGVNHLSTKIWIIK